MGRSVLVGMDGPRRRPEGEGRRWTERGRKVRVVGGEVGGRKEKGAVVREGRG